MSLWGNKETAAVTGTVDITNGAAAVVGTGTAFTTELKEGSFILVGGVKYKVLKITDNTHLTLTSNFEGTTVDDGTITKHLAPTYLTLAEARKTVFVDQTEAAVKANKDKGVTGAGWWLINTYTGADGAPRSKAECLVAMAVVAATSGDVEDLITADAQVTVTIGTQPSDQTAVEGAATFTVVATATSGNVTYQWQTAAAGTNRFSNIGGATSSSLALTSLAVGDNGKKYRVVVATDNGAAKVVSSAATLTVSA